MNPHDLLISWSIRISMLLFIVTLFLQVLSTDWQGWHSLAKLSKGLKILWTASFLLSLLHVVAAFHFVHHWSHGEAFLATANETRQKLGFAFGAGVYFNYFFLIVWAMDVWWTWRPPELASKPKQWLFFFGRCYLIFIAFNGVVVFKSGWPRILGAMAAVAFFWSVWHRHLRPPRI